MTLSKYITSINDRRLLSLSLLLFLPVLLDFMTVWRGAANSSVTMGLYGIFGAFMLRYSVRQIKSVNILVIVLFWLFCGFNYLLTPNLSEYFTDSSFILSSIFFFPISALIIFRIDNWGNFFKIFYPFAFFSAFLGVFIVFFSNSVQSGDGEFFSYMEFSYNMLPSCMALYCIWRQSKNILTLVAFIISLASIVSFGARAAVLFGLTFIACFELFATKIKPYKIILLAGLTIVIIIYLESIVGFLLQFGIFSDSRLLNHIVQENLFDSQGRDYLSSLCIQRIDNAGFEFSGMFGDRPYLHGGIYPHNIFYEIIMQYGWLIGTLILGYIIYAIGYDFFIKRYRIIVLYFVLALLGRYLISGSYLIEGKFWIFIFSILSIKYFCKKGKSIGNYA